MDPIKSIDDPRYVKAMSHPIRVRILAILQQRTASPNELAPLLGATLGTVAYHFRTLHGLGLVELARETRVRGAIEHHYRAAERPAVSDETWAQASPMAKQVAIGSSLAAVEELTRSSAAAGGFDRPDAELLRLSLRLDAKGFKQLSKAYARLHEQAERIGQQAAERIAADPDAGGGVDAGAVLMLFEATPVEPAQKPKRNGGRLRAADGVD